jgi:hypothetical protein
VPRWQESYPVLHRSLAPAYRELPRSQVEQVVRGVLGESSDLDSVEGFLDDLGRTLGSIGRTVGNAAQQAAPVLAQVAPGVLSGAVGGAGLGLPGIIGGALLGGVGSVLGQQGRPGPAPAMGGLPSAGGVSQPTGVQPPLLGGGAGSTGSIGQLLAALGSPTVQQALSSMLLGPVGNPTALAAGGSQLPVAAITNLLGMLANRASVEWESITPFGEATYGEGIDAANPEARAAWLYGQLEPVAMESDGQSDAEVADERWIDEMYDELEAAFYSEDDQ